MVLGHPEDIDRLEVMRVVAVEGVDVVARKRIVVVVVGVVGGLTTRSNLPRGSSKKASQDGKLELVEDHDHGSARARDGTPKRKNHGARVKKWVRD